MKRSFLVTLAMAIASAALGALAPVIAYAEEQQSFGPCQTAGQTAESSDLSGHYLCDGVYWRWVNEALPHDPPAGTIGDAWSADADLQAMWGQCKIFWKHHEVIKATFVFMDKPYEPDPLRIADVAHIGYNKVEVRVYPIFGKAILHAQQMVICHEYGHALFMPHSSHRASIMYEFFDLDTVDPRVLTGEDQRILERVWGKSFVLFGSNISR